MVALVLGWTSTLLLLLPKCQEEKSDTWRYFMHTYAQLSVTFSSHVPLFTTWAKLILQANCIKLCTKFNFLNPKYEGRRLLWNTINIAHCHTGQSYETWSTSDHYIICTSKNYIQLHTLDYNKYKNHSTWLMKLFHIILMIRYEITMINAHYSQWLHQYIMNSSKSILFWSHINDQCKYHRISAGLSAENC